MPDDVRTALYRFFDAEDGLLYVGITKNFGQRWNNHAQQKPWWPQAQRHTAEWFPSRRLAEEAEKRAVVDECPRYNVVHKPKPARVPKPQVVLPARPAADPNADYWTIDDVADHWGVKPQTIRSYRARNRGELPPPDKTFGRSPVWKPATILGFTRAGQGARTDLLPPADG